MPQHVTTQNVTIHNSFGKLLPYFLVGTGFGIVATKSQIISWYRMQEMFRFHSFHMFGIISSAIVVGAISVWLIKKLQTRHLGGEVIQMSTRVPGDGYRFWIGGSIFGLGWGLAGACPGPIFALLGNGIVGAAVLLVSALLGTWTYAVLRPYLPH